MGSMKMMEDALAGAISGSGWFPLHRALIQDVGLEAAALLHWLFNLRIRTRAGGRDDGWFFCTVKKMESELNLSGKQQARLMSILSIDRELIEVKKMGLPAKRHVRIDYHKVAETISTWTREQSSDAENGISSEAREGSSSDSQKGSTGASEKGGTGAPEKGMTFNKKRVNKKKERGGTSKSAPPTRGFISSEFDRKAAGRLREVLVMHGSDLTAPPRSVRIDTLAKVVTRLRIDRQVPEDDIREMIKWLKLNYSYPYTPAIRKADDLSTKWEQFRNAKVRMEVDGRDDGDKPPHPQAQLVKKVRRWLEDERELWIEDMPTQDDVDEALVHFGEKPGTLRWQEVE